MNQYTQLSQRERGSIFEGLKAGRTRGQIAALLGRHKTTVGREIRRNSDSSGYYYYPPDAQARSEKRKARHGYKVERTPGLQEYVLKGLKQYWSPIAIAGRWSLEHPDNTITKEAIYAWIYGPTGRALGLPKLLPNAKPKRGKVRAKKSKSHIPARVSIHDRPEVINSRSELGHMEGDLVFNSGSQSSNILTLIDRKSRLVMMIKNESKKTEVVVAATSREAQRLGAKSITFDNGSEFSSHKKLNEQHGIETYFCDPGAPWQKGTVENMNKQIRRFLPFKRHASEVTQEVANHVASILNNIPRKILGFKTALEAHGLQNQEIRGSRVKLAAPATQAIKVFNMKESNVALRYCLCHELIIEPTVIIYK
jgi:IS30 family transposase